MQDFTRDIKDPIIRRYVIRFFQNQPDFDIANSSVDAALAAPNAFENIPDQYRQAVIDELKKIQGVYDIKPVPETMPIMDGSEQAPQ